MKCQFLIEVQCSFASFTGPLPTRAIKIKMTFELVCVGLKVFSSPQCACAVRITVVGLSVCLSVCLSIGEHLMSGVSVRLENCHTLNGQQRSK